MSDDPIVKLESAIHGQAGEESPVLRLVDGPRPYLWIGGDLGCFATLKIPPRFQKRVRKLMREAVPDAK